MYLPSRTPTGTDAGARDLEPGTFLFDEGSGAPVATRFRPASEPRTGAEGNVVGLGVTSFFTDVSSEMVGSVLPLYLTLLYGFSPLQLGLFDGFYQGLAAIIALWAAVLADRRRRLKGMAGLGYGLSAVCTAGLVAVQGAWFGSVLFLYFDRTGKGIRTAPRDAIISLSVAKSRLAGAFGLHRAFDTAGAVAGPLVASIVLARNIDGYQSVFMVAFFASVVGVAALVLFVDGRRSALLGPNVAVEEGRGVGILVAPVVRPHPARRQGPDGRRTFRRALLLGAGLALLSPGDGLIFLTFQRDSMVTTAQFPLMYVGGSLVFLLAAYPVGRLADRFGRWRVFLVGEAMLVGVFVVLASGQRGIPALVVLVIMLGGRYAATDGILMAVASSALPTRLRTTGLGMVVAVLAVGHLFASIVYGSLWGSLGGAEAARCFAVALALVTAGGFLLLMHRPVGIDGGAQEDAQ